MKMVDEEGGVYSNFVFMIISKMHENIVNICVCLGEHMRVSNLG